MTSSKGFPGVQACAPDELGRFAVAAAGTHARTIVPCAASAWCLPWIVARPSLARLRAARLPWPGRAQRIARRHRSPLRVPISRFRPRRKQRRAVLLVRSAVRLALSYVLRRRERPWAGRILTPHAMFRLNPSDGPPLRATKNVSRSPCVVAVKVSGTRRVDARRDASLHAFSVALWNN